jgi:hypothetical protein
MIWIKGLALILALAGIAVIVNTEFTDVGYILLIEVGVLLTLVDENRKKGRRSPAHSA